MPSGEPRSFLLPQHPSCSPLPLSSFHSHLPFTVGWFLPSLKVLSKHSFLPASFFEGILGEQSELFLSSLSHNQAGRDDPKSHCEWTSKKNVLTRTVGVAYLLHFALEYSSCCPHISLTSDKVTGQPLIKPPAYIWPCDTIASSWGDKSMTNFISPWPCCWLALCFSFGFGG